MSAVATTLRFGLKYRRYDGKSRGQSHRTSSNMAVVIGGRMPAYHDGQPIRDKVSMVLRGPDGKIKDVREIDAQKETDAQEETDDRNN